jgi:HK97 family phage major capsid protein
MDVQMEALTKQVTDMQGLLATLAKEKGQNDGHVNADAIKRDELEKMKTDILAEMDKKMAVSRAPANPEPIKKDSIPFGKWLLAVKQNDHSILKTSMSEGTPAQGGYTVPTGQDTVIFGKLNDLTTVVPKCTPYPHGQSDGFTKNIPKWLTDLTVTWVNEAASKLYTKPTLQPMQSVLHKMAAIVTFTDEYLQDDTSNITQRVSELVGENMAVELERSILAGNTDPFIGVGFAVGVNAVAQAGLNLVYSDLLALLNNAGMLEQHRAGAELYMRRAVLNLIMGLVDGNGRPLWNINSINGAMVNTLLGIPINLSSQCVATQILYGNWKNVLVGYKAAGVGAGIQVDITNVGVDAAGANYWITDQTGYRFVMRRSIIVVNPEAFTRITAVA